MNPDIYQTGLAVAAFIYFVAVMLVLGRMLVGPNSLDRLLSLESMVALMQGLIAMYIVWTMETSWVYAMLVTALLGFISSLAVARYRVPDVRKTDRAGAPRGSESIPKKAESAKAEAKEAKEEN